MKNKIIAYIFLFIISVQIHAQQPAIEFQNYSDADGLSTSSVVSIAQDNKGFLWFGTEDGLNRFDGYRFTVFRRIEDDSASLYGNYIQSIWANSGDYLWIRTNENVLNRFNLQTEKVTRFQGLFESVGIPDDKRTAEFIDSKNCIWAGTCGSKIFRASLNDTISKNNIASFGHFINISGDTTLCIQSIVEDRMQNIWVIDSRSNIYIYPLLKKDDSIKFEKFHFGLPDLNDSSALVINAVAQDDQGNYWLVTNNSIVLLNSNKKIVKKWLYRSDYSNTKIIITEEDVWVSGFTLARIHRSDYKFNDYSYNPDNNQSPIVHAGSPGTLFVDNQNNVWTSSTSGVSKYNSVEKKFFLSRMYPNYLNPVDLNRVRSITSNDADIVWLGSDRYGVFSYNLFTGIYSHITKLNGREKSDQPDAQWALFYDGHELWLTSNDKMLVGYNPATGQRRDFPANGSNKNALSSGLIRTFLQDKNGNLWIGTQNGINRLDAKRKNIRAFYFTEFDSLYQYANRAIRCIEPENDSALWIGTWGAGFYLLQCRDAMHGVSTPVIKHYDIDNKFSVGLGRNHVNTICKASDGKLWLGTYGGGLYSFDKKSGKFKNYNSLNGLPNNVLYGILEDTHGNLWMSTNYGISMFDVKNETFTNYTKDDGLQGNEYNSGAYYKNKKGELFFGGTNGWNMFLPDSIRMNTFEPEIVFTDFQIYNKHIFPQQGSVLEKNLNYINEITLSPDQHVFSFEFAALNYTATAKNQYKYFLEGYDKEWQYTGNRRFVTFTNLYPGEYVLKVQGSNNDGVWSKKIKSLHIIIMPAYYQTVWFKMLVILAILFIFWSILFYYRRYRRIEQQKEKQIKAELEQVLHDGLKKRLTLLQGNSELIHIHIQQGENEKAAKTASDMSEIVQGAIFNIKHLSSDFGKEKVSLSKIISHIVEYSSFVTPRSINLQVDVPDATSDVSLSSLCSSHLLLIAEESLNNMVQHSGCRNAILKVHYADSHLIFELRDDGKGFDMNKLPRISGLKNIANRARKVKGSSSISSLPGKGTLISIKIPGT